MSLVLFLFGYMFLSSMYFLGLKQGLQTVASYNPLMKDFPLEQLLSATELDRIKDALVAIFAHLKKIKLSQYPIQRCLRLIEAISKDLMAQMLKVLGTRKFMLMNYELFEKVFYLKIHLSSPKLSIQK